jgi:signal transduction histidine kinase
LKLLTKTNLNFLSISLFIFLIGIFVFYYILRQQVYSNVNLELTKRKTSIIHQFDSSYFTAKIPERISEQIIIKQIDKRAHVTAGYSDTLIFNKLEKRHKVYRQLQFTTIYMGHNYHLRIFKSLEESDQLIVSIFLAMTVLVFVIIITLLLLNRRSTLRAWNVFYDTIEKIKHYDLDSHEQFSLKQSDVKEFDELNKVLLAMTDKIKVDYFNLKEYTENASHEIQTPLAIINAKMELLMQSGDL